MEGFEKNSDSKNSSFTDITETVVLNKMKVWQKKMVWKAKRIAVFPEVVLPGTSMQLRQ